MKKLAIIFCFLCMCLFLERTGIAQVEFLYSIGSEGSGDGQLSQPIFVTLDDIGNVYVTDAGANDRVSIFGNDGTFLSSFGSNGTGDGQFKFPGGIVLDDNGNIYVVDRTNNNVQIFDNSGSFLSSFGTAGTGNGQFDGSYGIALDSSGNIYVTEIGNDRVQVFDSSGNFQFTFGSTGIANGQFDSPIGIAVDDVGDIYVVDHLNHRIQIFDNAGNFLRTFGSSGSGNGLFDRPIGIALDEAGNIYVTEIGNDRVQVFNNAGNFQFTFGTSGTGDGEFRDPVGIIVVSQRIYVVDSGNNRVQVFELISDSTTVVPSSFTVSRGTYVSGGVAELTESDNLDLSLQRATADTQSSTEFEIKAVSPVASPSSLEVTLEGSVFARSQVDQTIELFDYISGSWEQVDTRAATRFTDSTVTVSATGNLSRFVEAGTMCIEARVRYKSDSPRQQFASNTDQTVWMIE